MTDMKNQVGGIHASDGLGDFIVLGPCHLENYFELWHTDQGLVVRAANSGDAGAQRELGRALLDGILINEDKKQGFQWLKLAADQGDADAQLRLAQCYRLGDGVDKDINLALHWADLGAKGWSARAQLAIGLKYLRKTPYPCANFYTGLNWIITAAGEGDFDALRVLAVYLLPTKDSAGNLGSEALRLVTSRLAPSGMRRFGSWLLRADGIPDSESEGFRLIQLAANSGDVDSSFILSECYQKGIGTRKNRKMANYWKNRVVAS